MSRLFGDSFQIAYLVDDLRSAIDYWAGSLGVGPFFIFPPRRFEWLEIGGRPAIDMNINAGLALGYSGDTQIELIVPGPAPSPYREFISSGGRGGHHLGFACRDFDRQVRLGRERGLAVAMEGASALTRFAYLSPDSGCVDTMIELIEMDEEVQIVFDAIQSAARDWDGSDPIRSL